PDDAADTALISSGRALEDLVEANEEPAEGAVNDFAQTVFRRVVRLQEQGRHRGAERQGVDGGDYDGNGDSQGELLVELSGQSADEGDRNEDGRQDEH